MRESVGYRYKSYRIEPRWKQAIEFAFADEDADDVSVPPRSPVDEAEMPTLEVPQQESVIEPPQAAPPREPVSLRSLLVEAAEGAADVDSRPDEQAAPQEAEDVQRRADDSDDLLDLSIIANIIGAGESDVKLIESMMTNGWKCTVDDLKDVFEDDKNVFVDVIIDDINDRAQDEMDDNLLEFESGRWEIHEDYRDAVETVLAHPDQYRQQID